MWLAVWLWRKLNLWKRNMACVGWRGCINICIMAATCTWKQYIEACDACQSDDLNQEGQWREDNVSVAVAICVAEIWRISMCGWYCISRKKYRKLSILRLSARISLKAKSMAKAKAGESKSGSNVACGCQLRNICGNSAGSYSMAFGWRNVEENEEMKMMKWRMTMKMKAGIAKMKMK